MKISDVILLWESYEFYNEKISEVEEHTFDKLESITRFLNQDYPTLGQRKRFKRQVTEKVGNLSSLYSKQIDIIDNLIIFYKEDSNKSQIPIEREMDFTQLLTLKNLTVTLLYNLVNQRESILKNI